MIDYAAGDLIEYRVFGGELRRARVIERSRDIKDGWPGFDAAVIGGAEDGAEVWGYDAQIQRVVEHA